VLLVTTTDMASGNATEVVTATGLRFLLEERAVRFAFMQAFSHHLDLVAASC
jgi:hypothetical protein